MENKNQEYAELLKATAKRIRKLKEPISEETLNSIKEISTTIIKQGQQEEITKYREARENRKKYSELLAKRRKEWFEKNPNSRYFPSPVIFVDEEKYKGQNFDERI